MSSTCPVLSCPVLSCVNVPHKTRWCRWLVNSVRMTSLECPPIPLSFPVFHSLLEKIWFSSPLTIWYGMMGGVESRNSYHFSCLLLLYLNRRFHSGHNILPFPTNHIIIYYNILFWTKYDMEWSTWHVMSSTSLVLSLICVSKSNLHTTHTLAPHRTHSHSHSHTGRYKSGWGWTRGWTSTYTMDT